MSKLAMETKKAAMHLTAAQCIDKKKIQLAAESTTGGEVQQNL